MLYFFLYLLSILSWKAGGWHILSGKGSMQITSICDNFKLSSSVMNLRD